MTTIQAHSAEVPLAQLGNRLAPLRLARPTQEEQMGRSLKQHGQLTPVTAFIAGAGLELIDGFKRLRASQKLGRPTLVVRALDMDEATATAAIATLHEHHSLSELEEGWLVQALHREHGLSQGVIGQMLRRHKSWVSRRLLLVDALDASVQGDVRLGLVSTRSAQAIAALPRGNQRSAAKAVIQWGLTTRQSEALVRRLNDLSSDGQRESLLKTWSPTHCQDSKKSDRCRSPQQQLLADITTMIRVAIRLKVRLRNPVHPAHSDAVREALGELQGLIGGLAKAITNALNQQEKVNALSQP